MGETHFIPIQRHTVIPRRRLIDLALSGDPALILFRGGGGTGKSVAAAHLARSFAAGESDDLGRGAVWIRTQPDETGLRAIWRRVFEAIAEAGYAGPDSAARDLAEGGMATDRPGVIVRAMAGVARHVMLILDDAHHALTSDVEESLLSVLEESPNLTVVITTRHSLPILSSVDARLRVPVRDIDAADLAFTREETAELVAVRAPDLTEDEQARMVEHIDRAAKGWPLAAHALIVERDGGRRTTRNHDRFIRELVDRLLASRPEEVGIALCAAALFPEISLDVLAQMLEIPTTQAQHIFEEALGPGFGYWTDEAGVRWYRHHELIETELRRRARRVLGDDRMRQICGRAAVAFRPSRPRQAIQAAIVAREWDLLSELLVEGLGLTLARGHEAIRLTDVPTEVQERYPIIAAYALIHEYAFPSGRMARMRTGFRMLTSRTLAAESAKQGLTGVVAAGLRMVVARLTGGEEDAVAMAERFQEGVQRLTDEELARYSGPLQTGVTQTAITLLHAGRFTDSLAVLEPMHSAQDRIESRSFAHALALTAWTHAWSGDMAQARQWVSTAGDFVLPVGWHSSYLGAGYRIAAALVALEESDPDAAEQQLTELAEHEATIEHWPFLAYLWASIAETRHGPAAGLDRLEQQLDRRRRKSGTSPTPRRMLRTLRARLQWQSGIVLPVGKRSDTDELAGAYGALSRGEYAMAAAHAADADRHPGLGGFPRARSEVLLVRAECARRLDDLPTAARFAARAAEVMMDHGLALPMRALPQDAAAALAELSPTLSVGHSSRGVTRDVRPLTAAEQRALVAVVEHGSVRAAAGALYLSPETVKGYLKQVYRKLGVSSRAEAMAVASGAGLLGEAHGGDDDDAGR